MGTSATTTIAQELARWSSDFVLSDAPDEVLDRVRLHVLDQVGAQVSCRDLEAPRLVRRYAVEYGAAGPCSILGTNTRSDAELAAMANATAGSSFEIDDYGADGAYAHPGCVVVPTALASAQEAGRGGTDFLRAVVVGYELVIRLAIATMPSLLQERGFHQTGAHGVFAAALVDAMIHGDDVPTMIDALAIAGSHAGGTTEFSQTGGEVKRVHSGIGVSGGIRSARLARLGLTGPPTIFEGRRGFLQAFCNSYEESALVEDLGKRWRFLEHGAIKPYACCGLVHHHFAALDTLTAQYSFAPEDIERIELGCEALTLIHNGSAGPHPSDMIGAQFSAEFGIAMRIVGGRNDVGAYLDAEAGRFADPRVLALAERVRLEVDDECNSGTPAGRVTLHLRSGERLSALGYALGSPLNPMGASAVQQKYADLVSRDFGDDVAERSAALIGTIENLPSLDALADVFTPQQSSAQA